MFRATAYILIGFSAVHAKTASTHGEVRGAAIAGDALYTWGEQLTKWELPNLEGKVLASGDFGEGGCLADLDNDGALEFMAYEGPGLGRLTRRRGPDWQPKIIDTEIEMHDCREATLFGRRGILMVNRGMQVRFYEMPVTGASHWPYREIYSFYTASYQGDLVLNDIDGDGRTDILCGNYWIQSPASFDLPWRLFAINTHHGTPMSALVRFAPLSNKELWVFQSHMEQARAMLFNRPEDPKQLWNESRYGEALQPVNLHGVAILGRDVLVGEHNGAKSRLFLFRPGAEPRVLLRAFDVLQIFARAGNELLVVGPRAVMTWTYRPRR